MKTRTDPSTKPYYKCLSCPRFRKVCGGIPTREMDLKTVALNDVHYLRKDDAKTLTFLTSSGLLILLKILYGYTY